VLTLTCTIALGDFTRVAAGGAETFLLVFARQTGIGHALRGIIVPAPIGTIIGGTGLFVLLARAQVRQEL
jgi:formate/nitrite transporter FocA (FNT family)